MTWNLERNLMTYATYFLLISIYYLPRNRVITFQTLKVNKDPKRLKVLNDLLEMTSFYFHTLEPEKHNVAENTLHVCKKITAFDNLINNKTFDYCL